MQNQINNQNAIHNIYDAGGYCHGFDSIINKNMLYPELKSNLFDKFSVPLKFRISKEGSLFDIKNTDNNSIIELNNKYTNTMFTNDKEFETEAKRLLRMTGNWIPHTYHGGYVDIEKIVFINFVYHKEYFLPDKNGFVLNPDTKPEFIGDKLIYNNIVHPSNGSDGMVTFIGIVELDGTISNEYWINCQGKTNPEIGLSYLKKLAPWKPAELKGEKVRSQLIITVQTQ